MGYEKAFHEAWSAGGPKGALAFLATIFHHPDNQHIKGKPTDYLSDDDDETRTPEQGFDQLARLFSPKEPLEARVDLVVESLSASRSSESDQSHRIQPFNGIILRVGTYGHGDGGFDSVHVDFETGAWKSQYGLNHEVIAESDTYDEETEDDEDSYEFIYELENGDSYNLCFEGEKLSGKQLFRHIRMAQFGGLAAEIVDVLLQREIFADFPKALPFRFFVAPGESYDKGQLEPMLEFHAPLAEATLAEHPLRERYLAAAEPPPEATPEDRWLYLLKYIDEPRAPELDQLVDLLRDNPQLLDHTLALADEALIRWQESAEEEGPGAAPGEPQCLTQARERVREAPRVFARVFWRLGGTHPELAEDYSRRTLALPLPELPRNDIEAAILEAREALENIYPVWAYVAESARPTLQSAYDEARRRVSAVDHPVLQVLAMEGELRLAHGDKAIRDEGYGELGFDVDLIPDAYVEAVGACIDEMPQKFEWYGDKWSFVMNRLEGLGARARSVAPRVVQLMNDYCTELHDGGRALESFADILVKLGLDEPPALIRDYAEGKEYHNIDGYAEWASRVPSRMWDQLADDFAADPEKYTAAAPWEHALYDSKKGIDLFAKKITEAKNSEAFLKAIARAASDDREEAKAPGQLLTRLVYRLAEMAFKKKHKTDRRPSSTVISLLGAMPTLDEAPAAGLRKARLLQLRWAIDEGEGSASSRLAELQSLYPGHPMLMFNHVEVVNAAEGARRASQAALEAIETLAANDLVYRKAFLQLTAPDNEIPSTASPEAAYALFRWATDHFVARNYEHGAFDGDTRALEHDPFYDALEKAAMWSELERSATLADIGAELELAGKLHQASDDELCEVLCPETWSVTLQVARRLVKNTERYGGRLLDAYDWFRENEERRMALASLYWPVESFREVLLRHPGFAQDLPWFIRRYPGISAVDLARQVFALCDDLSMPELVLQTARGLNIDTVLGCFLSVNNAIQKLRAFDEGIALMEAALSDGDHEVGKRARRKRRGAIEKKPELVLIKTNIAVFHVLKGDLPAAEAVFDDLFARDFSRFDYDPGEEDDLMAGILGGDLDAQIAGVFRQYFASAKYNVACLYAKTERPEAAVEALREAREYFKDNYGIEKIDNESDFDAIREHPTFRGLMAAIQKGGA